MKLFVWCLLFIALLLVLLPAIAQDTLTYSPLPYNYVIAQQPVDSAAVVAEAIKDHGNLFDKVFDSLDFKETAKVVYRFLDILYIFCVIVSYYIVVTRLSFIPTNSFGKRNAVMIVLTVGYGVAFCYWQGTPLMSIIVSGLSINFAYEFLFKIIFRSLERFGWAPLPKWYLEQMEVEAQRNIEHVKTSRQNTNNPNL